MNLLEIYKDHHRHYAIFDKSVDELADYIEPMQQHIDPDSWGDDCWVGVRLSGKFFAYNRPCVWVYMRNSKEHVYKNRKKAIEYAPYFWLLIVTVDDSYLNVRWNSLTEEQIQEIMYYFNTNIELESASDILHYLTFVLGKPQESDWQ